MKQTIEQKDQCLSDPMYFYRNCVHISHPIMGEKLFVPHPIQEITLNNYTNSPRNLTMGSRQTGITTMSLAHALYITVLNKNRYVMLAADRVACAQNMLFGAQRNDHLPKWIKPALKSRNRNKLEFENGSTIFACGSDENAGRGVSVTDIIWDNAWHTSEYNMREFWRAITPQLEGGASIIMTGTGCEKYRTKKFTELWNSDGWTKNFIHWSDIPSRGDAFRKNMIEMLGEEQWRREYELPLESDEIFSWQEIQS